MARRIFSVFVRILETDPRICRISESTFAFDRTGTAAQRACAHCTGVDAPMELRPELRPAPHCPTLATMVLAPMPAIPL